MKLTLFAAATATVASAINIEDDVDFPAFQKFIAKYNRRYNGQSDVQGRFAIFKDNLKVIRQRNAGKGTAVHGINKFTDIHPQEFKSMYLGYKPSPSRSRREFLKQFNETEILAAPKAVDWRNAKPAVLTPVKNQGQCGSCWAFSTTEQIESDRALAGHGLTVLAPQQIVSCDTTDDGCNGGNPMNAYAYVQNVGGIEFSKDYPYTSGTTEANGVCKFKKADLAANTAPTGYSIISSQPTQESNMYTQILKSPMSVCVDATLWQTYQSGVITKADNCGTSIDHAVQAVGIGGVDRNGKATSRTGAYWIVRNSWAADWGEEGFVFVQTGGNVCGITAEATITNPQ
jgi:hypothetical protein